MLNKDRTYVIVLVTAVLVMVALLSLVTV